MFRREQSFISVYFYTRATLWNLFLQYLNLSLPFTESWWRANSLEAWSHWPATIQDHHGPDDWRNLVLLGGPVFCCSAQKSWVTWITFPPEQRNGPLRLYSQRQLHNCFGSAILLHLLLTLNLCNPQKVLQVNVLETGQIKSSI